MNDVDDEFRRITDRWRSHYDDGLDWPWPVNAATWAAVWLFCLLTGLILVLGVWQVIR